MLVLVVSYRLRAACVFLVLMSLVTHATALDPFFTPSFKVENIVGSWSLQLGQVKHVVKLEANGTFHGTKIDTGIIVEEYRGRWTKDDRDLLIWTYDAGKSGKVVTDTDQVVGLNADAMSLRTSDGKLRTWHRETSRSR